MRTGSEAVFEILIDGDELHLIEQGHEDKSDDKLSDHEAYHHLHVGETLLCHHARYRDEGDTGEERSHRSDGYQEPRLFPSTYEESLIIGLASGKPRHGKEHDEVGKYC